MKKKKYELLYEDQDYVFIDKAASLLSLPDRWDQDIPSAYGYMNERYGKIYVIHRLDKETSGVMAFAKNEKAHAHANKLFDSRKIKKEYLAILEGNISNSEGTVDQPLQNLAGGKGKQQIHIDGKASQTAYKVVENYRGYAQVCFYPKTGRTHQIRVHAAFLGAPILCDKMYGYSHEFMVSSIKKKKYKTKKFDIERPLLSRQALHAKQLSFEDLSGKTISAEAPLPKDMRAAINQMSKLIPQQEGA